MNTFGKLVIGFLFVLSFGAIAYAVDQPQNIGYAGTDNPFGLYSRTLAQLNALQPGTTGQLAHCSDCEFALAVSSGSTAAGQWVVTCSTSTAATAVPAANPMRAQ